MATKIIAHEWELPLPNEFLVDHSQSEGKTRTVTYHGPDKIYLQIGADGRELYGPLAEDDLADGRPTPVDVVELFEVDCTVYPLICQLRGPVIDERQEEKDPEDIPHPGSPLIEGYPQFNYALPLFPSDVFDSRTLRVVDGIPTVGTFSVQQKLANSETDKTWDDIRAHRDRELNNSDGSIAEDMPESMKTAWKEYRQKLRDFPATMEAAGVHPNIADMMFPIQPFFTNPPSDPETPADSSSAWEPPSV